MSAAAVHPEDMQELARLLAEHEKACRFQRLQVEFAAPYAGPGTIGPYPRQVEFHQMGATCPERAFIAGNRTGKTRTCGGEVAMHLTGWYPSWWEGHRFSEPTDWIVAAPTNELTRDICQMELFGKMIEGERRPTGEGWVPRHLIGQFSFRQCGVSNVADIVFVRHISGEWSVCNFKSYEQGDIKFQGVSRHGVWLDEEPPDHKIYTECQTRVIDKKGLILFSRTPLFGMSETVRHFTAGGPGIGMVTMTWDDALHLDEAEKQRLMLSYPEHERDTRTLGTPMMGTGGVYPISEAEIICEPFAIPRHFSRICGVDFGIDHPAAAAWLAHDRDTDIIYLYDSYKLAGKTPVDHARQINARGKWIPVAWPHDGLNREKGSGKNLADMYGDAGVNMLMMSARFDDDKGGPQSREAASLELLERMRSGTFKVFSNQTAFLEEKRLLHRENGRIVPEFDDIESAVRYGYLMLRYAGTETESDLTARRPRQTAAYDPFASM